MQCTLETRLKSSGSSANFAHSATLGGEPCRWHLQAAQTCNLTYGGFLLDNLLDSINNRSLYSQSAPIGWLQSANRLEFPIGSIGWWRRSADRLWQTRLPAFGRPIGCGRLKKVVTKTFAPKFCAECTDRHIHSSHGDYFRDHFCVYVSGQLLVNFWPNPLKIDRLDRPG